MPIFLSTGIGVGVLAGVVSGVCYLLVNSIRWSGRSGDSSSLQLPDPEPYDKNRCAVCRQVFPPGLPARGATCRCCGLKVCRGRGCSDWDQGAKKWDCYLCQKNRELHLRTGQWFFNQIQRKFRTTEPEHLRVDKLIRNADRGRESSELPGSRGSLFNRETQREVREFVEQLVSSMVGGSLDDVIVSRMYKHPQYLPLGEGENPGVAHVTLKRLVQRVIEEAMNLPDLLDLSGIEERKSDSLGEDFDPTTYEELLATAVLNKVIESYQNKLNCTDQSSGINSGGSDLDSNSNILYSKNHENIPINIKRVESEFSSQSSLEPISHDESYQSESSGNQTEPPMSLTIEECIEEITTGDSSIDNQDPVESNLEDYYISANLDYLQNHRVPFPDFGSDDSKDVDKLNSLTDISMNGTHSPTSNTWEENWLFQKKRLRSSPTPVPMLVPSPTAEFRALIGDRDAEDTTDLSEAGSDMDDSMEDPIEVPNILVQSKKIIGGKNPNMIDYEDESCNLVADNEDIVKLKHGTTKESDIIEPPSMFVGKLEEDFSLKRVDDGAEELGSLGIVCDIRDGIKEFHELAEAKNIELLDNTGLSDSGSQKDRELAEQYDAAPQRVIERIEPKDEGINVEMIANTESAKPIPAPRNISLDECEEHDKIAAVCEPPRPGNNVDIIDSIISTVFQDTNQHDSLDALSTNTPVVDPSSVSEIEQPPIYGAYDAIANKPECFVDSILTTNMTSAVSEVVEVHQCSLEVMEAPVEAEKLVDISELTKVVVDPDYKDPYVDQNIVPPVYDRYNPLEASNSFDEYEDCEETLDTNQGTEQGLKPEEIALEKSQSDVELIEIKNANEILSLPKVVDDIDDDLLITDELAGVVLSTVNDIQEDEYICEEFVESADSLTKLQIPKILVECVDSPPVQIEEIIETNNAENIEVQDDASSDDLDDFVIIENQAVVTEPELIVEKMIVIEEQSENINYITSTVLDHSTIALEKTPENVVVEEVVKENVCVIKRNDELSNENIFDEVKEETANIMQQSIVTFEEKSQIAIIDNLNEENITVVSKEQSIISLEETPQSGTIEIIDDLSSEDIKIIDQIPLVPLVADIVEKLPEQALIIEEQVTVSLEEEPTEGTIQVEEIIPEDIQIIDEVQVKTADIVDTTENLPQNALMIEKEHLIIIDEVQFESAEIVNEVERVPQEALIIEGQSIIIDPVLIETAEVIRETEKLPQNALIVEEQPIVVDVVQLESAEIVNEVERLPQNALVIEAQPIITDILHLQTAKVITEAEKLPQAAVVVEEEPIAIDIVHLETAEIVKEVEELPRKALVVEEEAIVNDVIQFETAEIVKEIEQFSREPLIVQEEPIFMNMVQLETAEIVKEVEELPSKALFVKEEAIVNDVVHFETVKVVREIKKLPEQALIVQEEPTVKYVSSVGNIEIVEKLPLESQSTDSGNKPNIADKIKEEVQFVNEHFTILKEQTPQTSITEIYPENKEKVKVIESTSSPVTTPNRYKSSLLADLVYKSPPEVITIKTKNFTNSPAVSRTNNLPGALESGDNCVSNNTNTDDTDKTLQLDDKFFGDSADWVEEEIILDDDDSVPGSIAEREHLKWQNAVPLANNPYSQEAIEKRKASSNATLLPTRMIPEQLVGDDIPPPTPTSPLPTSQGGTPLQVVLGAGQPDYKSISSPEDGLAGYGRDYYINDAKKSAGTRKKQELLYASDDVPDVAQEFIKKVTSPKELESTDYLHTSYIENSEPIFRAKPIIIDETDSDVTHRAVKVDTLNDEDDRPGIRMSRPTSLNLDYEDTRVYNISTGTTKIINGFENKGTVKTPPPTPVDHCPVQSTPLGVEKMKFDNKITSPLKTPEWTQRSAGLVHNISPLKKLVIPTEENQDDIKENSSVREKSTKDAINEKIVEETVIMPSVRELAKNFLNDKKDESNKTKIINLKEPAEPLVIKPKDSNLYQVNSSLTARSVPKQFREDLKSTAAIELPAFKRGKTPEPISEPEEEPVVVRPRSRTGSPVVRSGSLRNSIAFFEQLKNK